MDVTALQRVIDGTVVASGADDYETVRRTMLWNQLCPERRPDAIVRVANQDDVVAAVRFAGEHRVQVAIRSGGHSWCGSPLRDGGLLLDLGRLNALSIDAAARTAAVQPAVTGRDLSRPLAAQGLAFPVGHCSTVAVGGYLLSGGFGWNAGVWGPACLNVQAIDVVTAGGEIVRASESENADLLWAARGAGPAFFGVVTCFHLAVHPSPRAVMTSTYVYPLVVLPQLAAWLPALAAALPREVELTVLLTGTPPRGTASADGEWLCLLTATAFVDDERTAVAALAALEQSPVLSAALAVERNRPTPFEALFDMLDGHFPMRHRYIADTVWSDDPPARVLTSVQELLARAPSPLSRLLCVMPPAAPAAGAATDSALSMSAGLFVACYAIWDDPAADGVNRAWHRDAIAALEPFAVGHYIGESDLVTTPARLPRCFAPANWQRLQALRRQYDPNGVFHS